MSSRSFVAFALLMLFAFPAWSSTSNQHCEAYDQYTNYLARITNDVKKLRHIVRNESFTMDQRAEAFAQLQRLRPYVKTIHTLDTSLSKASLHTIKQGEFSPETCEQFTNLHELRMMFGHSRLTIKELNVFWQNYQLAGN